MKVGSPSMSSTSARTRANRENSKKSTGPRTAQGKAAVSHNARQHGLSGGFSILAHEDRAEFQHLLDEYRAEFQPKSPDEIFLIEQMTQARWTLARARRIEAHLLNQLAGVELPVDDPDACIAFQLEEKSGNALNTIQRYASAAERTYFRSRRELQQARSRELRNKATEAQNWLREQLMGTSPRDEPHYPEHHHDDTIFSPSSRRPGNGDFPDKL